MQKEVFKFVLSKGNLIELIKKYYAENGRNVSIGIYYEVDYNMGLGEDAVKTIISASENVSIAGMNLQKQFDLSVDEVKDIVKNVFEKDGYEFVYLKNNVSSKKSILKALVETDYGRAIINKTFTVCAKVKEEEKVLQKKIENNK